MSYRFREAREKAGLSAAEVGRRIGVSHPAVTQWETGVECLQFFRQSFSDSRNCRHSFVIQLFRPCGICSIPPPPDLASGIQAADGVCSHCRNQYILQLQP